MVAGLARLISKGGKEIASEMEDLFSSTAKRETREIPDAPVEETSTPVAREIPDAPVEETSTPVAREIPDAPVEETPAPVAREIFDEPIEETPISTAISKEEDITQAEELVANPEKLKAWQNNKEAEVGGSQRQENPELAKQAAEDLYQRKITSKQAREIIKNELPITSTYTKEDVDELIPSVTEVVGALGKKAFKDGSRVLKVKGFDLKDGERVASRLDIPSYNRFNTWVVSIHEKGRKGRSKGYGQAIRLKNIEFTSDSKDALNIARGKRFSPKEQKDIGMGKATIARIQGDYVKSEPEDLVALAKELIDDPEWTQVGMNPYRGSFFYNKETGTPVFEADEVIQVGPLVLAKNIKKPTITQLKQLAVYDTIEKNGKVKKTNIRLFNEGGMAMNKKTMSKQMELFQEGGLADQGGEIDMESGNEVPTGSLKEEVRDDIPANLSEGEFVMPAYAVRFHGIDKMMQLVDEAKVKLERMEQMGMMGNSEEATLPDDTLLEGGQKEQEALNYQVGGYVQPVVGAPVQPYVPGQTVFSPPPAASSIPQQPSTVASQFNIQPTPQTYQQQTGYTPPVIQPVPIQQRQTTPRFKDYLISSGGKYDELREYVNDAGNILTIPFIQGRPIYPVPEGYRPRKTDSVESDEVTTTTTTVTPKETDGEDPVTVTGKNQANIGGLSPGEVASGVSKDKSVQNKIGLSLSELNKSPMAKVALGFALGGPIGAIGSVVGLAAKEMLGVNIPSITDLASKVFGKPQNQLSQTELDQISNLTSAQTQASIAGALGVDSLSGNYGNKPGDIDAATGGIFNDRGIAMAVDVTGRIIGQATGPDDDLPSFNSIGSWGKELSTSFDTGWYGGPQGPQSLQDMDRETLDNYGKYAEAVGGKTKQDYEDEQANRDFDDLMDMGEDRTKQEIALDDELEEEEAAAEQAAAAAAEAAAEAKEETLSQDERDEMEDSGANPDTGQSPAEDMGDI